MRHNYVHHASSYHTDRALRDTLAAEAGIIDAWTQARQGCSREDLANVDEDIEIGAQESKLVFDQADTTEYRTQDFVTRSEVQK